MPDGPRLPGYPFENHGFSAFEGQPNDRVGLGADSPGGRPPGIPEALADNRPARLRMAQSEACRFCRRMLLARVLVQVSSSQQPEILAGKNREEPPPRLQGLPTTTAGWLVGCARSGMQSRVGCDPASYLRGTCPPEDASRLVPASLLRRNRIFFTPARTPAARFRKARLRPRSPSRYTSSRPRSPDPPTKSRRRALRQPY